MNDQNTLGNEILLEAIRAEWKAGWFGQPKAEIKPPPLIEGTSLFVRVQSATGESSLRLIQSADQPIPLAPADWAVFLRAYAQHVPMKLAFPAAGLDAKGRPLDVILEGTWQVTDARCFLQSGAEAMVAPDRPLRNSDLQLLVVTWIRHCVCDQLAAEANERTIEELCSAQVLPPSWWQKRLDEWLLQFGLSAQLTNARLECIEADQEKALQSQLDSLKQLADRQAALREARQQLAKEDLQQARDMAEQAIKQARTKADEAIALEAINTQLGQYRIACRQQVAEADDKLQQTIRQAAEAQTNHLLAMARKQAEIVDAQQAALDLKQEREHVREKAQEQQKINIASLQTIQKAVLAAQAAQDELSAHIANLVARRHKWEVAEQEKDSVADSEAKDIDRQTGIQEARINQQTRIQEARNRLRKAELDAEEAERRAKASRAAVSRPLENPCPYPHCHIDLSVGQTFTCHRCEDRLHVWHRSHEDPALCEACYRIVHRRKVRVLAGIVAIMILTVAFVLGYQSWRLPPVIETDVVVAVRTLVDGQMTDNQAAGLAIAAQFRGAGFRVEVARLSQGTALERLWGRYRCRYAVSGTVRAEYVGAETVAGTMQHTFSGQAVLNLVKAGTSASIDSSEMKDRRADSSKPMAAVKAAEAVAAQAAVELCRRLPGAKGPGAQ